MKKEKTRKKKGGMNNEDMKLTQKLAALFEARNIEEYIDARKRPLRLIYWNFIIGVSRGVGFLLGATVLGALFIALGKSMLHHLGGMPWLGEKIAQAYLYISEIVKNSASGGN
jgi:hypothetical protein